ncbi:hypothetical protein VP01_1097g3 [Puccinia sorghi]|uniref:RNA-binding protein VTS1 n=1 Tax=Puccinia sorghi TaxID=27349 RepID=A0A0L6VSZ4_9BASI|nr:hypothetical protein VP01_1097g3 [Puccinia sorghi]
MRSTNLNRHQHSLSTCTTGNQHLGSFFHHHGGARSAGGPRQSLDVTRSLAVNGPISPRPPGLSQLRPNSEILQASGQPTQGESSAEAIDKWFEDLKSYEATLEEMAAASLDVNFQEELNAIEQWFRVLSEAERTAALYSLMQMEAKLSQLSMKSPASPMRRQFAHQSLTPNVNVSSTENFLSPNAALFNESHISNDPASLLSAQRAKFNTQASDRLSAPGQLLSANNSIRSPKWNSFSGLVDEEPVSRASSPRPQSNGMNQNINSQNTFHPGFSRSINPSISVVDGPLSPAMGGSWASQVNTPLVPMFANKDKPNGQTSDTTSQNFNDTSNRLAQWGAVHQAGSNNGSHGAPSATPNLAMSHSSSLNGLPLDDARKFRRSSKSVAVDGSGGFAGATSGINTRSNGAGLSQGSNHLSEKTSQSTAQTRSPNPSVIGTAAPSPTPMTSQPMPGAQKAAMAAQQNWRQKLNSPSVPPTNQPDPALLKDLAMMNTLTAGFNAGVNGMNINGMANLAAMANITDPSALQNVANLLNMRQQMQQVQNFQSLQQQLQQGGLITGGAIASPRSARFGMNFGFPMLAGSPNGMGNKRSPAARGSGKPTHTPGSGSNPDEDLDMNLLNDIPAWLRGLRLHKYTPNFAGCTWQEMVLMSDATLEARGVAAVGARRKMLKTFENVRIIKGMALPGDGHKKHQPPAGNMDGPGADRNAEQVAPAQAPESDKDSNK